jgi:glycerol-3-phosphate dehydrogenase (NAD(P)+)
LGTSLIVILGDGAWGRALAGIARDCGHEVAVWNRNQPAKAALARADGLIVAVPAQVVGEVLSGISCSRHAAVIITAKGIEQKSNRFMHEVVRAVLPDNQGLILSGPSFAEDVARGLPTAVALAADRLELASQWAALLSRRHFRIYASDDLTGVALGGALKNVLAIACGIADGRQLGASARAALTARGFAELSRLGRALGARTETLMGLSGLGDLLLTCSSPQSRNYSFGVRIGQGQSIEQALALAPGVVEGASTAEAAMTLARRFQVSMPIAEAVASILKGHARVDDVIIGLLDRPLATE